MNLIDTLKNIQFIEKKIANLEDLCERHYDKMERDSKKLKALEIIKKKGVSIWALESSHSVEQYNSIRNSWECNACAFVRELTQEEHDLLKEVLL